MRGFSGWRWAVVGAVGLSIATGGCVKNVEHKIARHRNGTLATTQPVPIGGWYKVKVARKGEDEYRSVRGTHVVLRGGDPAGFHVNDSGMVYATAGDRMMPLELPADWKKLTWQTHYKTETQFSHEMKEALGSAAQVVAGAAVLVGVSALFVAVHLDDEDDREDRRGERR